MRNNSGALYISDLKQETGSMYQLRYEYVLFSDYRVITLPTLKRFNQKHIDNMKEKYEGIIELDWDSPPLQAAEQDVKIVAGVPPYIKYKETCDPNLVGSCSMELGIDLLFEVLQAADEGCLTKGFGAISSSKIIQLCRKFGLICDYDNELITQQYEIQGFNLEHSKAAISDLYKRFMVYRAVSQDDADYLHDLLPIMLTTDSVFADLYESYFASGVPSEEQVLRVYKLFLTSAPGILDPINVRYNPQKNCFYLESTSCDILSACNNMLSLLIAGDKRQGKNIRKCVVCNKHFFGHGNAQYCGTPCNKGMEYMRKKRFRTK